MTATWTSTVNRSVGQAVSSSDLDTYIGVNGNLDYLKNNALAGNVTQSQPTRVLGTVYHNTGSTALFVSVAVGDTSFGTNYVYEADAYTGATSSPNTTVASATLQTPTGLGGSSRWVSTLSFVVPPGYYYKVLDNSSSGGAIGISTWTEWALS